ncbi:MAG: class I SAM-dependent methyltransferase, partial [Candidatus Heimdallarchaeota archaeon]|nr:class I SAM-dependent methyltransferase [Candidatus Heimdallarchaeota archaeon]
MVDVFGSILRDLSESALPIFYEIERDDGLLEQRNASVYFTKPSQWSFNELEILKHVISPVIDLGAGGGRHSYYLQTNGHQVKAIDLSAGAIEV